MHWRFLARAAACAAALGALALPAVSQVMISPVIVEMSAAGRPSVVSVTLSDKAPGAVRLQAQLLHWEQGLGGQAITRPSDDVLVSPRIAELRPGQRQLFRLAWRAGAAPTTEKTYRLVLEDVQEAAKTEDAAMAIRFRMRYDLAVLVAPAAKPVTALQWTPCSTGGTVTPACVRVTNAGNRRLKLQTLTLVGEGWQEQMSFKDGATLLAGAEREWQLPASTSARGTVRELRALTVQGESVPAQPGGG